MAKTKKKKKKYEPWDDLQKALLKRLSDSEAVMRQKMSKYYLSEASRLDSEIAAFYQKYGQGNVIQYRTLMQSLPDADRALLMRDLNAFASKYPQYAYLLPVRENIYKLNRLEGLQASLRVQQLEIGVYESAQVEAHLKAVGEDSFRAVSLLMGHEYDPEAVRKFVDFANVDDNIFNNKAKLAEYLAADIAQGIARGDSYKRISKALCERMTKVSQRDINRLVYTQGTLMYNEATAGVVEADFDEYEISTVGDQKVCKICKDLEGKVFSFSDRKVGTNFPPLHPWCRCSFTVVIEDRDQWIDDYISRHGGSAADADDTLRRITG